MRYLPHAQLNITLMTNYRKLKSQIHKGGIGYVFEPTPEQLKESDWQIWSQDAVSKHKLIKLLVSIIGKKEALSSCI